MDVIPHSVCTAASCPSLSSRLNGSIPVRCSRGLPWHLRNCYSVLRTWYYNDTLPGQCTLKTLECTLV